MSKKNKKVYTTLNYTENFFIFFSAVTGCISISVFTSLLSIPIGITTSAIRLKISAITVEIKGYRSIIKRKKKHGKIVFSTKIELNSIKA